MSVPAIAWAMGQDLPPHEKWVLVYLAWKIRDAGPFYASAGAIAAGTHLSLSTVKRATAALEAAGLLEGIRRHRQATGWKLSTVGFTVTLKAEIVEGHGEPIEGHTDPLHRSHRHPYRQDMEIDKAKRARAIVENADRKPFDGRSTWSKL